MIDVLGCVGAECAGSILCEQDTVPFALGDAVAVVILVESIVWNARLAALLVGSVGLKFFAADAADAFVLGHGVHAPLLTAGCFGFFCAAPFTMPTDISGDRTDGNLRFSA